MDCHQERDSTVWDKGIWLGKSETNPKHIVETKNGAMARVGGLEPTKHSETSLLLEIQGSGTWYQTHRVVGDARNI